MKHRPRSCRRAAPQQGSSGASARRLRAAGPLSLLLGALLGVAPLSCRKTNVPAELPTTPSVRLYILSNVAGAMEPCGCRKDMLGGIDHAAALLAREAPGAPRRLLLAAGPLLFQEPTLAPERREQDLWKAEALASSLADIELAAWAPGRNDYAAGASELARLAGLSGSKLLGASPPSSEGATTSTAVFEVGPYKVGVAGLGAGPTPMAAADAARALSDAAQVLSAAGAQIRVALIAAQRGDGLRLAEKVPGFDVVALGKPIESGDANDAASAPALVGETLVVQTPNHLQALGYVDLFVRGEDFSFEDGVGIALAERRQSVESRLTELEARKARIAADPSAAEQLAAMDAQIARARVERAELERAAAAPPKTQGSVFRYAEAPVREDLGSAPAVASRMSEYYRRVNEHNRVALAGRKPPPLPLEAAGYVGGQSCTFCHRSADTFWQRTQHAQAYATLVRDHKEFNLDCVSCHVTGYERPGGSTVTHVERLKNVQCEACHGPGSRHASTGGDTELITLRPAESTCKGCHHAPHVADDWDLAASWLKIIGPGHGEGSTPPGHD